MLTGWRSRTPRGGTLSPQAAHAGGDESAQIKLNGFNSNQTKSRAGADAASPRGAEGDASRGGVSPGESHMEKLSIRNFLAMKFATRF